MQENANILIVDDNQSQCRTMALVLTRQGHDVTTAINGPEAIKKVKEKPFDFIFIDVKMPVMNGVDTYKEIKKIQPSAVALIMTAYAVEDLVQEALHEGVYGVVYKPLNIEKIMSIIEEAKLSKN